MSCIPEAQINPPDKVKNITQVGTVIKKYNCLGYKHSELKKLFYESFDSCLLNINSELQHINRLQKGKLLKC